MDEGRFERTQLRLWLWLATPVVLALAAVLFSGLYLRGVRRALVQREALLESTVSLEKRLHDVDGVLKSVLAEAGQSTEAAAETTRRINQAAQRAGFNIRSLDVDKTAGQSGGLKTLSISVQGEGPLQSVIGWLDELQMPGLLLRVVAAKLTSLGLPPDSNVSGEFTLMLYLKAT